MHTAKQDVRELLDHLPGLAAGLAVLLLLFAANGAHAVNLVTEPFTGATAPYANWPISGNAAFITATQADATSGTVVQLTPATNTQAGTLVYDNAFSSAIGATVTFNYFMGGGTGADGFSFFLVNGTETSVTPGKSGGTLGYGTDYSSTNGVPNAYAAVGFDVYGNCRNEFGNSAGTGPNNGGALTNNVCIGGSGNTTSGYRYLTGSQQTTIGSDTTWRKAEIIVKRGDGTNGCVLNGVCLSVRFSADNGSTWTQVYTDYRVDNATGQAAIPDTFKLGFSGSTGGSNNKHYIDNVQIDITGYQLSILKTGTGTGTVTSTSSPTQSTQINCGSTCTVAYSQDTVVTLTATAASGSEFTGWSGDCSGTSTVVAVTMNAAKTCTATFAAIYTVSTSAGTGGSISPASASVTDGNTTSFTVTPSTGYSTNTVSGCGGSLSGTTYTTGAITGACAVTASFSLNSYTVSTSAGAGGSISPSSASVAHGGTTSFTATPDTGYNIAGVSGCGGSLSGTTYTTGAITGACAVTASFSSAGATHVTSGGGALGWLSLAGLLLLALRRQPRLTAAALLLTVMSARAGADGGWYAGLQAGRANSDVDATTVTQEIAARGISGTASINDSTRNAWKGFGGYEYGNYFAVEAGYTDLGRIDTSFNGMGVVNLKDLEGILPASGTGFEVAAIGRYLLAERLTGFARAGIWRWKARYDLTDANGNVFTSRQTGTNTLLGLGVETLVQDNWSARLAWERYRIGSDHSDFIGIGAVYRFAR